VPWLHCSVRPAGHAVLARLEPSDGELLGRFFHRLSPETVYRRFLSPITRLEQARPDRLLDVDHASREALVAVVDGEIVGVARYARLGDTDTAELAVVVADAWQRRGIATRLLAALRSAPRARASAGWRSCPNADNRRALALLRRFHPRRQADRVGRLHGGHRPGGAAVSRPARDVRPQGPSPARPARAGGPERPADPLAAPSLRRGERRAGHDARGRRPAGRGVPWSWWRAA